MELFPESEKALHERLKNSAPLAHRMRPRSLSEFVGQEHILGEGKILRRAIEADRISSIILFGPPGCGKTALAYVIANTTKSHFCHINAAISNLSEVRSLIKEAQLRLDRDGQKTIFFIDEIHRFNKLQQDALMPHVEDGTIVLIGATVYNPFFSVIPPLVSRSQIFEMYPLKDEEIRRIIERALKDEERGLGKMKIKIEEDALNHLITMADGDARKALNGLEVAALTTTPKEDGTIHITLPIMEECIQKKAVLYDRAGDAHYDVASAFIKSMRGSDPDATIYWLARMIHSGEDPRFIARRIVICAAEDVGNADPQALVVATAALHAVEAIGMPEAKIPLAQAALYIACAPKSNAAYEAISRALEDVEKGKLLQVPMHLRGTGYRGAKKLGRGIGYKYPHAFPGGWVEQEYMPERRRYYTPTERGYEKVMKERLEHLRGRVMIGKMEEKLARKEEIRRKLLKQRARMSREEINRKGKRIKEHLFSLDAYKDAKAVMFYVSKGCEVPTHEMIKEALAQGKKVVVPVVVRENNTLLPSLIEDFEELAEGAFGILEPREVKPFDPLELDLILVPGIAFDRRGARIGHGAGFYDNFLSSLEEGKLTIGLAYAFQVLEHIPVTPNDVFVDLIITEEGPVRCIQ